MTITFENENNIIVYALEKIICYARKHQYIFIAQSVWWIASIIGLADGLTTHINNLRIRSEINPALLKDNQLSSELEVAVVPPDNLDIDIKENHIHPERISRVTNIDSDISEDENNKSEPDQATLVVQSARRFINQSKKARKALKQKPCALSQTRSGKVSRKPLTKKQRNRLQAIPRDTLVCYLKHRE